MPETPGDRTSRRFLVLVAVSALAVMSVSCSDDGGTRAASDARSDRTAGVETDGSGTAADGSDTSTGGSDAERRAEERRRAEAASTAPSGVDGVVAPNDDGGARNLAPVDPTSGPQAQDTSGSVAVDPLVSPVPTLPEPGRPDVAGLPALDGCEDLTGPFYRAVSRLGPTSTPQQVVDGVADLTRVAQRAQAPIADAVRVLLVTAQSAAADAARIPDFGAPAFQDAVRTVHVFLGDTCGR